MPAPAIDTPTIVAFGAPLSVALVSLTVAGYRKLHSSHADLSERVAVLDSKVQRLETSETEQNVRHDRLEQMVSELKADLRAGFARVEALLSGRKP